ncbi:MAG: SDR family oxidoreductase, partial [Pseudomonadota bacterium]
IGYGDIARRAARLLVAKGHRLSGLCRHPENKPAEQGVELIAADAGNEQDLKAVLHGHEYGAIIVTLTPSEYNQEGYRNGYVVPCRHLQQVINGLDYSPYVIYVSSTGVYGQREGEWIDEDSRTEPDSDSGRMLLQAERLIHDLPVPTTILRCSGIYGPGRDFMLRQLKQQKVTLRDSWSNRIHQHDVARFIEFIIENPEKRDSLYLLNDDAPTKQYEVYQWLAHQLAVEISSEIQPGPGPRGSKRCNNSKLKSTGFQLQYPTFKNGYGEMLPNV